MVDASSLVDSLEKRSSLRSFEAHKLQVPAHPFISLQPFFSILSLNISFFTVHMFGRPSYFLVAIAMAQAQDPQAP